MSQSIQPSTQQQNSNQQDNNETGQRWFPTWTQAMSDNSKEDDEPGFDNVTVRMTVPASIGGDQIRLEMSNRFGKEPVRIGRCAVRVGEQSRTVTFSGQPSVEIAAGASTWSDPVELAVHHADNVSIDVYLPEPTPYVTAGGFRFDRSEPGDYAGADDFPLQGSLKAADESREFPATNTETDGTGWSLAVGGPYLRTVEVSGTEPQAVVVCLGGSSTALGWPQEAAAQLPAAAKIAVVNRGIAGNRVRLDAPEQTPSWGLSGLSRFDDDVLGTAGATHLVIAYNSNDWGLPGRVTSIDEMPTLDQLIDGYQQLINRAEAAGLTVILATVTPLAPEMADDALREGLRCGLNDWIRNTGHPVADFDAAIRNQANPKALDPRYAAPDFTHPGANGLKRLGQVMIEVLGQLGLQVTID